jgi:uncharacterized membrane protein (DUF485 family)
LNAYLATIVLFSTVLAALGIGVLAASWVVTGILDAFGPRTHENAAPAFIPTQTHASGD